jgi:pimeloyl-ACP methyl ester carboxylesterase
LRLTLERWGEEGSPLAVLVHGVTASSRTWWRVGPWFATAGWCVVAVDLRGHGKSPRATHGLGLEDLAGDLHETVAALLGPEKSVDVLLGHSLGALAALELCRRHGDLVERLVLEEPPGSESIDFEEISRGDEADLARAKEAPEAHKLEQLEENPSWSEGDAVANVEGLRDCDAGPVAATIRHGLHYDLTALVGSVKVSPPCSSWGAKRAARPFPSPSGRPWRARCAGALWRRLMLATEYTGMTLRATSDF